MNSVIIIAKVTSAKLSDLQKISRDTFFETFASTNAASDMDYYLTNNFSISQLEKELNDPNSEFYFASINNEIIGYLKINFTNVDELTKGNGLEIARIYILKKYHGNGIAQELYKLVISIATNLNYNYIWLGVWEHNPRAIRFYEKCGFEKFGTTKFMLGSDEQTDFLMMKTI